MIRQGKQTKYYPDGKILETAEYKKGYLNGPCKIYTPDGDLRSECTYKNDKLVGDKIIYHPNGTIALISPHKDGKPHGVIEIPVKLQAFMKGEKKSTSLSKDFKTFKEFLMEKYKKNSLYLDK